MRKLESIPAIVGSPEDNKFICEELFPPWYLPELALPVVSDQELETQLYKPQSFHSFKNFLAKGENIERKHSFSSFTIERKRKSLESCWAEEKEIIKAPKLETQFKPFLERFELPVRMIEARGCRPWSSMEEIFLVGIIFDVLFQTGTLVPTKSQREKKYFCWDRIKHHFDTALGRYKYLSQVGEERLKCRTRTKFAIKRHYKVMKAQQGLPDLEKDEKPRFKQLHEEWEHIYNIDNRLMCSMKKFAQLVQKLTN